MAVNSQHPEYTRMLPKWERCRDVAAGQDAIHAAGTRYLSKLKDQPDPDYHSYLGRATFYNATWRTIAGLIGMVFRKPPRLVLPIEVQTMLDEDADGEGQPIQLVLQSVVEDSLKLGRVAVLVDYPEAPPNITLADARLLNLRPTIAVYSAFALINWKTAKIGKQSVLVQAVLKEIEWEATDEYTGKEADRWRVLDLTQFPDGYRYRQRLFKMERAGTKNIAPTFTQIGEDIYPKLGNAFLDFIPLSVMGTDDVSTKTDDPPLIDLVDVNLAHFRTTADYEHGCHFTALPTLFLAGFKRDQDRAGNEKQVYIGSEAAIISDNPNAKASFVEFSGSGLAALEKNLDRKEAQMAVLGARMLEPMKRGVEAAETASIHRKGEESTLSSISQAIGLGMTSVLKWFTAWAGYDPSGVVVELNRNFYPVPMTPSMLSALIAAWQQGAPGMSDQGLFEQLKAGELVADETTLEEEQARIAQRQQENLNQQIAANEAMAAAAPAVGATQ